MNNAAGIAQALGLRRSGKLWCGACPNCSYEGAFTVRDGGGRTLFRCHAGCGQNDVLSALRSGGLWHADGRRFPEPLLATREAAGAAAALALWRRTVPAAEAYLRCRGISVTTPPALRFHPALRHLPSGLALPALMAAVTVWPETRPCAVHRTWLRPDGGGKAAVEPQRMTLGPVRGAPSGWRRPDRFSP